MINLDGATYNRTNPFKVHTMDQDWCVIAIGDNSGSLHSSCNSSSGNLSANTRAVNSNPTLDILKDVPGTELNPLRDSELMSKFNSDAKEKEMENSQHNISACITGQDQVDTATKCDQEFVACMISDIAQNRKLSSTRNQCLFYKIVQGGNVESVEVVLNLLKCDEYQRERLWLLGTDHDVKGYTPNTHGEKKHAKNVFPFWQRFVLFIPLCLLHILLTPVIYWLHAACRAICWKLVAGRIDDADDCPFTIVALSESKPMMKIFKDEGLSPMTKDKRGNNVLHHLCFLAQQESHRAVAIFELILDVYSDFDFRKLVQSRNDIGFSPLELAAKSGCWSLLRSMICSRRTLKTNVIHVTESDIQINLSDPQTRLIRTEADEGAKPRTKCASSATSRRYVLDDYDVSEYESGDFLRNQSLLLSLLTDVDVTQMPDEEQRSVIEDPFFKKWISAKLTSMLVPRLLINGFGVFITLLYVWSTSYVGASIPLSGKFYDKWREAGTTLGSQIYNLTKSEVESYFDDYTIADFNSLCFEDQTFFGGVNHNSSCVLVGLQYLAEQCPSLTEKEITIGAGVAPHLPMDGEVGRVIVTVCAGLILTFDILTRLVVVWKTLEGFRGKHMFLSLKSVFLRGLPGSLIGKQKSVMAFTVICIIDVIQRFEMQLIAIVSSVDILTVFRIDTFFAHLEQITEYRQLISALTSFAFLTRFLSLIFTLRLIPVMGHFVLTIYKMAEELGKFLVVYMIMFAGFSLTFHLLMLNPQCPSVRIEPFHNFASSCYQTFLTSLGYGEEFPADTSRTVKVVIVFYLVVCVLMLLNLIIAVMSTVTEHLSGRLMQKSMRILEALKDAIAAEALLHMTFGPWAPQLQRWVLQRTGLIVRAGQSDGETFDPGYSAYVQVSQSLSRKDEE